MSRYINKDTLIRFLKDTRKQLPHDSINFFTRDNMLLSFEQTVNLMDDVSFMTVSEFAKVCKALCGLSAHTMEKSCAMSTTRKNMKKSAKETFVMFGLKCS